MTSSRSRRRWGLPEFLLGRLRRSLPPADVNQAAQRVAALHRDHGGATYNLSFGDVSGERLYSVSIYPERSRRTRGADLDSDLVQRFITENLDLLGDPRHSLGTWFNDANGITYLDVSVTLPTRRQAVAVGRQYNQIAGYDLRRMEEFPIGGTGEEVPDLPPPVERLAALRPRRRRRRRMHDAED